MKILIKGKDGSVAIMSLLEGVDVDDAVKKFKQSHPDLYGDYFEFNSGLPSREFRDAWIHKGKEIVIDSSKARNIHLGRVRKARNLELDKLDREHLRYLSNPEKIKEIEDKKQELRDLPAKINSLEWPNILEK